MKHLNAQQIGALKKETGKRLPLKIKIKMKAFYIAGKINPKIQSLLFPQMSKEKTVFEAKKAAALKTVHEKFKEKLLERVRQGHNIRVDRKKRIKKERKLNPVPVKHAGSVEDYSFAHDGYWLRKGHYAYKEKNRPGQVEIWVAA